jgi:pimeloyl-ACP methyl ester carboxylesterase
MAHGDRTGMVNGKTVGGLGSAPRGCLSLELRAPAVYAPHVLPRASRRRTAAVRVTGSPSRRRRVLLATTAAVLLTLAGAVTPAAAKKPARGSAAKPHKRAAQAAIPRARHGIRVWTIHYRSHLGLPTAAYVALPASYGPHHHPPIPLVISPHGRGVSGRANLRLWGSLPAVGFFAVVSPDGHGRVLSEMSWGYPGQIDDLARMPEILRLTLPWLKVDRSRVYAVGGSMGGQESLLLLARHPHLLAGVAAFDSVTDFAAQYKNFRQFTCRLQCRENWGAPLGKALRQLARIEVGGTPRTARLAFARRSPISYVRRIASSGVQLQLWWSVKDTVVPQRNSSRLASQITQLNPEAPLDEYVGFWRHSAEMRASTRLPIALMAFDLLPQDYPVGRFPFIRAGLLGPGALEPGRNGR